MVGLGHIALAAVVALGGEASDPHGAGAIDSIDFGSTASMAAHGASMQNATVVAGEGGSGGALGVWVVHLCATPAPLASALV